MVYAYCHRSGHIGFSEGLAGIPDGTIIFAKGEGEEFQAQVSARARHARDCDALLVPGCPEAEDEAEAFKAFQSWRRWVFPDQEWFAIEETR